MRAILRESVNSIIRESCETGSKYWDDIERDVKDYFPNWTRRLVKGRHLYLKYSDFVQVNTNGKFAINCRWEVVEIDYSLFDKSMLKNLVEILYKLLFIPLFIVAMGFFYFFFIFFLFLGY